MQRRKFLKNGLIMVASTTVIPEVTFFKKQNHHDINFSHEALTYIRDFQEFTEIERILKAYGAATVTASHFEVEQDHIHLATLSATYGRWSNFSFSSTLKKDFLKNLFIHTAGPAGKKLHGSTNICVVSKVSQALTGKNLIYDAYPHVFNQVTASSFNSEQRTYFVDRTTRPPLHINVLLDKSKLSAIDLGRIRHLSQKLQNAMNKHSQNSLSIIASLAPVHDFSEILDLGKLQFSSKG